MAAVDSGVSAPLDELTLNTLRFRDSPLFTMRRLPSFESASEVGLAPPVANGDPATLVSVVAAPLPAI